MTIKLTISLQNPDNMLIELPDGNEVTIPTLSSMEIPRILAKLEYQAARDKWLETNEVTRPKLKMPKKKMVSEVPEINVDKLNLALLGLD